MRGFLQCCQAWTYPGLLNPLCGKSLHLPWALCHPCTSQGISTVSPGWILRDFPYRCGLLFLPPLHCANTQSILVETTKQHHLLSFLLLSHLMLVPQGVWMPGEHLGEQLPGSAGQSPFLAPTSRGQSRLLLVSHLFALLPSGCAELESLLPGAEQPLRLCVYDLCLRHVSFPIESLAAAPAAAFPPGAKAGRSLLHVKAPQSIPAGGRGSRLAQGEPGCLSVHPQSLPCSLLLVTSP